MQWYRRIKVRVATRRGQAHGIDRKMAQNRKRLPHLLMVSSIGWHGEYEIAANLLFIRGSRPSPLCRQHQNIGASPADPAKARAI